MSELERRLQDAAGPLATFPHDTIRRRVRRRQQTRVGVSAVAVVAVGVSIGMAVLPRQPAVDLQVGAGPSAQTVDIDLVDAPTRLPDGYRRCGTVTHDRDVTVQTFCAPQAGNLVLRFGPHGQLPELGDHIDEVAGRPVYVDTIDGRRHVTISDRQAPDDRHYRVEAPATLPVDELVDVITSVPAFENATSTPTS